MDEGRGRQQCLKTDGRAVLWEDGGRCASGGTRASIEHGTDRLGRDTVVSHPRTHRDGFENRGLPLSL
eukprot:scaffold325443_cov58-Tisochrysis_lutea.AAC.1